MFTFIRNSFGDQYFHEVNGISFNKFGALNTLSKRFDEVLLAKEFLYIIIGTDSGLIPAYLLQKGIPSDSEYIFVETDELYSAIEQVFPEHPQLHLCKEDQWESLAESLNLTLYIQANNAQFINSIGASAASHTPYLDLVKSCKVTFDGQVHLALKDAEFLPFYKTSLINLPDNVNSISTLQHPAEKSTAIILGAGPSLDQHIEWIKQNQKYLYIFSVSRLSKKLLEVGITPDFIVTVDLQDISYRLGKESFEFEKRSTLIHAFHANPLLVGQWLGEKVFTGIRVPWESKLNNGCYQQSGTTVTNIAYDAVNYLAFKQILLAGVDFCNDSAGFTHAEGSGSESECAPALKKTQSYVVNNRGEEAETTAEFRQAGLDFSAQASIFAESGVQTINLSGSAMRMDHIDFIPPEKLVFNQIEKRKLEIIDKSPVNFYKISLKELLKAKNELQQLSLLATQAIDKNKILFDENGDRNAKVEQQLEKLERKIHNNNNVYIPLIKQLGIRESLKLLRATRRGGAKWTQQEVTESSIAYLEVFKHNTIRFSELINYTIQRIRSRQQELATPNQKLVRKLLLQWKKDKQPRRRLLLRDTEFYKHPSKEVNELLCELNEIETELANLSSFESLESEMWVKTDEMFKDIVLYTQAGNIKELKELFNKLQLQPDVKIIYSFSKMLEGIINHLEGESGTAFLMLTNLLEEGEPFRHGGGDDEDVGRDKMEFVLSKVSAIAIELRDYTSALDSLKTLSQSYSSHYTPKFAELLYLTGNLERSLTIYQEHISQNPDDLDTVFGLAELQRKEQLIESAIQLYRYILGKNPSYAPALQRLNELSTSAPPSPPTA